MSPQRLNADQFMRRIAREDVMQKWPQAFIEDPSLTPEVFYDILRSVKFNIAEAQLKVIELVRKPDEFIIPAALLNDPLPSPPLSTPATPQIQDDTSSNTLLSPSNILPTIEDQDLPTACELPPGQHKNQTKPKSTSEIKGLAFIDTSDDDSPARLNTSFKHLETVVSKRRAPIEDSDDETLPVRSKRNKSRSSPTSPGQTFSSKTKTICGFLVDAESDDDEEPPCTASRRASKGRSSAPFCRTTPISCLTTGKSSQNSLEHSIQTANGSNDTDENSGESADNATEKRNIKLQGSPCHDRGFSTTPDFGDESEYEVPSDNEQLREVSPHQWPTTPPAAFKRHNFSGGSSAKQTHFSNSTIWVTPLIASQWKKYYPDSLDQVPVANALFLSHQALNLQDELRVLRDQAEKHTCASINEIKLSGLIKHDRKVDRKYFASADINGVRIFPEDYVMVASQGLDIPEMRQDIDDTEIGSTADPWFAQVIFIFQDEYEEKMVHLRWFEHGARTLLGQTASPRELFLFQSCDDNPLGCIFKKIRVDFIQESNKYDADSTDARFIEEGHYFFRQYWHPESRSFTHAAAPQLGDRASQEHPNFCECCREKTEKEAKTETKVLSTIASDYGRPIIQDFVLQGITYRLYDFVYIVNGQREIYEIGQITKIYLPRGSPLEKKLSLGIALYKRLDDLLQSPSEKPKVRDCRRIFATGATINIDAVNLDGKCFVFHKDHIEDLNKFKDQKDTFWVQHRIPEYINPRSPSIELRDLRLLDPNEMKYSDQSKLEFFTKMRREQEFLEHGEKPRTLELFNGIGGLTVGFQGICGKTNAVEIDEAACHTMRSNQPDIIVHHCDASLLLSRAIRRDQGETLQALFDKNGKLVPDLPRRGEVDLIKGGPPCPGYSGANMHKRVADPRNGLVALFLAYVHFYQPKYSLIENVVGLIRHDLAVPQKSGDGIEPEIKHGTIKMIFRTFTSMGYQVQCAILHAEEHGAPQSRPRVLIWATLPGCRLPEYPQPENIYKSRADSSLFDPERKLGTFDFYWHRQRRSAPHRVVTLGDAFLDLPAFDWKNPHRVVKKGQDHERRERERWGQVNLYDPFEAETPYVGRNVQSYSSKPLTEYQRQVRTGIISNTLMNHVTAKLHALSTERVCSVPLRSGASYKNLPHGLKNSHKTPSRNCCARLDLDEIQNACMTKMEVLGRYGKVLHPTQHRIESVREYARVQGFPDSYVFDLDNWTVGDAIRGIGNAVPIPLGRSLAEGFLQSWMEHKNTSVKICDATQVNYGRSGCSKDDAIDLVSDDDE